MPKLKVGHISPTPDEEAAINAGIAADPDARELDAEWFAKAKPASEVLPPDVYATLIEIQQRCISVARKAKHHLALVEHHMPAWLMPSETLLSFLSGRDDSLAQE